MYSGIIRHRGQIQQIETRRNGGLKSRIKVPASFLVRLTKGSSISVAGICLTVVKSGRHWLETDLMPQTVRLTTAGLWRPGVLVNLERSLRLGDEIGGHLVFGHVDGIAKVIGKKRKGEAVVLTFRSPSAFSNMIVPRGAIAIDGVGLTVAAATDRRFSVSCVRETLRRTTLGQTTIGDPVNIEIDSLARYLVNFLTSKK